MIQEVQRPLGEHPVGADDEPVDEADRSWIRLVDVGEQVVLHRLRGSLPSALVPLGALHAGALRVGSPVPSPFESRNERG